MKELPRVLRAYLERELPVQQPLDEHALAVHPQERHDLLLDLISQQVTDVIPDRVGDPPRDLPVVIERRIAQPHDPALMAQRVLGDAVGVRDAEKGRQLPFRRFLREPRQRGTSALPPPPDVPLGSQQRLQGLPRCPRGIHRALPRVRYCLPESGNDILGSLRRGQPADQVRPGRRR